MTDRMQTQIHGARLANGSRLFGSPKLNRDNNRCRMQIACVRALLACLFQLGPVNARRADRTVKMAGSGRVFRGTTPYQGDRVRGETGTTADRAEDRGRQK